MRKQAWIAFMLLALLSGCGNQENDPDAPGSTSAAAAPSQPGKAQPGTSLPLPVKPAAPDDLAVGERVYRNTCSLCHRLGVKGAPRLGDGKDWASRLAQGNEALYDHAVRGYRGSKGSMPSRGSNAKLSENEVKAAVDYMVQYSVPTSHDLFGSHVFSAASKQSTIH